jgi:regulator of protease activity HflC (stomatin/prohibitin superfamily)
MKGLQTVAKIVVLGAIALWIVPWIFFTKVEPGQIGVRRSATGGVEAGDLGPGWRLRFPGLHKLTYLPSTYFFLDYTDDDSRPQEALQIRTKDNNNVTLDVSVPVRIKPGRGFAIVKDGNHQQEADGRFRYMRLAEQTAVSVLREELANLDSVGFYSTDRRVEISGKALTMLNDALTPLNLEAQAVLIRAVRFRPEYETAAAADPAQRAEQAARPRAVQARRRAAEARQLQPGHRGAGQRPRAGLEEAPGRARARLPDRRPRHRRSGAGQGPRRAGGADPRAGHRGQTAGRDRARPGRSQPRCPTRT